MTWRGAGLLAVCIAIVAVGAAVPSLLFVGLALAVVAVVAIVVDSRRAPGKAALRLDRVCNDLL
jgi:hypothetical protein